MRELNASLFSPENTGITGNNSLTFIFKNLKIEKYITIKCDYSVVVFSSPLRAASKVCQARVAHLIRTGKRRTPDKAIISPISSIEISDSSEEVSICLIIEDSAFAIFSDLPFISVVIKEAEAFEIAQPSP